MPKTYPSLFHILPRDAKGGLTSFAKAQLVENRTKLSVEREQTSEGAKDASAVLRAFRKVLPRTVSFPDKSPFMILVATKIRPGGALAECKCQCSITNDCGGGGGGGGKLKELLSAATNPQPE